MSKEELIQFEGLVIEILPDARYSVPGAKEDFIPQNQPAVARAA